MLQLYCTHNNKQVKLNAPCSSKCFDSLYAEPFHFIFRDDDSDDEIDDQDIHKIMIVTQTPPPIKKHDRTGNYVTRVKMTQELSKAINDGLYYYEQVWQRKFSLVFFQAIPLE